MGEICMQYFSNRSRRGVKEAYERTRVVYASYLDQEEFLQLPRTFHCHGNTLELVLVMSGSTLAIIDGVPWNAAAGDILLYNKGSFHQEVAEQSHEFSLYCVAASGVQLPGLPEDHICGKKAPRVVHTGSDFEMFRLLFSRIFEIVRNGDSGQAPLLDGYMKALLGEVVLKCEQQKEVSSPKASGKRNLSEEILEWINNHYTENVSLALIARELSTSPDNVSHIFKKKYGYSPMQYMNFLRVGQAQIRLIETKDKISDIAVDVGYNNIGNFNRSFFLVTGLSPREFRKAHVRQEGKKGLP